MMPLNTEPTTPGLRTGREPAELVTLLIQVPRVTEPRRRGRIWRPETAGSTRRAWPSPARAARPRRRLRRGVRRAGWSLLVLASMAATFTMGWTTRGSGVPRLASPRAVAFGRDEGRGWFSARSGSRPTADAAAYGDTESDANADADADLDAIAIRPDIGPPIADAEVPVIFPGYVLPDDRREEPTHAGG